VQTISTTEQTISANKKAISASEKTISANDPGGQTAAVSAIAKRLLLFFSRLAPPHYPGHVLVEISNQQVCSNYGWMPQSKSNSHVKVYY
jgi:hypothetical protein